MAAQEQEHSKTAVGEVVDRARAARRAGRIEDAIKALDQASRSFPASSLVFRELGDGLGEIGRIDEARAAFAQAAALDEHRAAMGAAVADMRAGRLGEAEARLKAIQAADPTHVYSSLALASLALKAGDPGAALAALETAAMRYPHFEPVQHTLAQAHFARDDYAAAAQAAEALTRIAPDRAESWLALGDTAMAALDPVKARDAFEMSLGRAPGHARAHLGLGHALKALGEADAAAQAYRQAAALDATLGEAWWSLADLKTYRFSADEIASMRARCSDPAVGPYDQASLHYALGKAAEDDGDVDAAFKAYARGASIRARLEPFDPERFRAACLSAQRACPTLPPRLAGPPERPTAIFIIGLPRSGSTLVEQILASHSQVWAAGELPFWPIYARELAGQGDYGEAISALSETDILALGERYRAESARHQGDSAYFIDKTPNNFLHVGLITRALPEAIVIDVRRDPRDWAWSAFRQSFGRGQAFSYDLRHLAAYYRSYADLVDQWRAASPGRIIQLKYEALVDAPHAQITQLLEACGLTFEPACLQFHQSKRAVTTPSAQQVRQPIFKTGKGQWRRVAHHLSPFIEALEQAP
jgi:tetratricopeptide (TPR) repeat protein